MQQYYQPQHLTSTIPPQQSQNTSGLYLITIAISLVVLLLLIMGLTFSAPFLGLTSVTLSVVIAILSLGVGLITGFILHSIAASNKSFLLGAAIISFLCATIVSIYLSVQKKIAEELAMLGTDGFAGGVVELVVGTTPNPPLTAVLIILFFNITPIILFFRKEEKHLRDFMIYLYSTVIFLILYLTAAYVIVPLTFQ